MYLNKIIGEKYRIVDILGKGGTSVVFLAENMTLGNLWAVKAISKDSPWLSQEIKEVNLLKELSHPMLPRIADFIEDESMCYIVMDYFSGCNLSDYIKKHGKVPEKTLLQWTKDLIGVLDYLHRRNPPIIYRDMKPANIIMDDNGHIKLVDMGTARFNHEDGTDDTVYIGTRGYAAPEQHGLGTSDQRTDYYALGMTLIHLATGIHPLNIDRTDIRKILIQSGVSKGFADFVINLVQTDAAKRPQNPDELAKAFEKITESKIFFFKRRDPVVSSPIKSVIAVSSILQNSGVTSFCVMLGYYFKKQGLNVAIAEINGSGDFERMKQEFRKQGLLDNDSGRFFKTDGITFYPAVQEVGQIPKKGFDIIVTDLGAMKNDRIARELNNGDIKIIICPNVFWKLFYISEFTERFSSFMHEDWIYVINATDRQEEKELKKQCNLENIVAFPPVKNIFNPSKNDEELIGEAVTKAYNCAGHKVFFKRGRII
ncbi:MAG: protein kinase [Clostridiaceae bacterium]|nr:protein kinase [Clostridiaceae bacterium]